MLHILVEVFGGLGLFFVGINLLSDSIKKLGSGYAPGIIRAFSKSDFTSAIGGLISGVVTSSGKAVTFSLIALAELGQLNLRKCLPIVAGGSIGSAFIVLWASIDFQMFVFILMGVAGALNQFGNQKNEKLKLTTGVILGFALLFYGLELIKMGAAPMKELPWFNDYMQASQGHWLIALVMGTVLSFLTQSGSSVAIVAMSLVNVGMLGFDEAVMMVFGTNVGSGISTAMLGLGLSGIGRQLVFFHGFFKIVGIFVMIPILVIEVYGGTPLIKEFVRHLSDNPSTQIAGIYLLYEIITGIAVAGFFTPIARWFESAKTKPLSLPKNEEHSDYLARIALAYPDGTNVKHLVKTLEKEGIKVIAIQRYDSDWRTILKKSGAQALLIELDSDTDTNFGLLENILEESSIPVIFNEHYNQKDAGPNIDMGKKLAEKLLSKMVPETTNSRVAI